MVLLHGIMRYRLGILVEVLGNGLLDRRMDYIKALFITPVFPLQLFDKIRGWNPRLLCPVHDALHAVWFIRDRLKGMKTSLSP